jgi:hypothetical protein
MKKFDLKIDLEGLKSLVWIYGGREGVITPKTWELIISKVLYGTHVPGDIFMADVYKDDYGFSVKTTKRLFTKNDNQTVEYIQCRCPVKGDKNIGDEVVKTLVNKREESFEEFGLNTMFDVLIIHNRIGNKYNVRMFINEQPKYENMDIEWIGSCGYVNVDKSKKGWKTKWELKRKDGDDVSRQTCLFIKKVYNVSKCFAEFTVECEDEYDVDMEYAKKKYSEAQSNSNSLSEES